MQGLIAKCGLAAHLAFLAVAPLVLYPFCDGSTIATVILWLSLFAGFWVVLEPSVRGDEQLHAARKRVLHRTLRDPLFWVLIVYVLFYGLRALNSGIACRYDAEKSVWYVSSAWLQFFPGSVDNAGYLPFAASVGLFVLIQGCRHALSRSTRTIFLLMSVAGAGLAALIALFAIREGCCGAIALMPTPDLGDFSFFGYSFGLYLICAVVVLYAAFEQGKSRLFPFVFLGIAGVGAGLFVFAPPYLAFGLVCGVVAVLLYSFLYACWQRRDMNLGFKLLVLFGLSLTIGGLVVALCLPKDVLTARLAEFKGFALLPEEYWKRRSVLSAVAFSSWLDQIWIGTGLGSFWLDFRFAAQQSDWVLFPNGVKALANGWWFLLAEQGIVGLVFLILPLGFLSFLYVQRFVASIAGFALPHPIGFMLPLLLVAFVGGGFFDCSLLRAESVMAMGAFAAVSAASFQRLKRGKNG